MAPIPNVLLCQDSCCLLVLSYTSFVIKKVVSVRWGGVLEFAISGACSVDVVAIVAVTGREERWL